MDSLPNTLNVEQSQKKETKVVSGASGVRRDSTGTLSLFASSGTEERSFLRKTQGSDEMQLHSPASWTSSALGNQ